jgi:hypothetical protein
MLLFLVGYLTTISVSRLYGVDYRMVIEYGTVGGIRLDKGKGITWWGHPPVPHCPP